MRTILATAIALPLLASTAFAGDWVVNQTAFGTTVSSASHDVTIKVGSTEEGQAIAGVLNDFDDRKKKKKDKKKG